MEPGLIFLNKIKVDDKRCWNWVGRVNSSGDPEVRIDGKYILARDFAYRMIVGEIPKGARIVPKCWNKLCVSPEHAKIFIRQEDFSTRRVELHRNKIEAESKKELLPFS